MPSLDSPLKTPFIQVLNNKGQQLITNEYGDLSVVSVKYIYDDEEDDTCVLKLQMVDPEALDILGIARETKLQMRWGYLGGPVTPLVLVVVRDMTSKYGSNIIYTELECTDYLTYIKTARSEDGKTGSYMDYIRAQMHGKFNIVIKDRGKKIYAQVKRKREENVARIVRGAAPDYEHPFPDIMFDPIDQIIDEMIEEDDTPIGSRIIAEMIGPTLEGTWFITDTHPVYKYLNESIGVLTANRSTFMVLQSLFRKCPRGPWFITGRGETLFIHNRDMGKKIYKQYTYKAEPSQLIDFTAKTKFENFNKQVVSYAGMDPKERANFFVDDYRKALYSQRNPKEILDDKEISEDEMAEELRKYYNLRDAIYPKWGVDLFEGMHIRPVPEILRIGPQEYSDDPWVRELEKAKAEQTADPWLLVDRWPYKHLGAGIIRYKWYTMPLESYAEAVNVVNSRQREMAMEKEEGKIILQGDPWLRSELTLKILNVHSQHEGQYYIKKCEHRITNQGYKVTLDCIKVVPGSILTTLGSISQEEYDALDDVARSVFEKQYKREQELFGQDVKIATPVQGYIHTNVGVYERSKMGYEEKGYISNEDINELIRLSRTSDSSISFNPENK